MRHEWTNIICMAVTLIFLLIWIICTYFSNKKMYIEITEIERNRVETIQENQLKYYQEYKKYSEDLEWTLKKLMFRNYGLMVIICGIVGVIIWVTFFF